MQIYAASFLALWRILFLNTSYTVSGHAVAAPPRLYERSISGYPTATLNASVARTSASVHKSSQSYSTVAVSTSQHLTSDSCPSVYINGGMCWLVVGNVDIYYWPEPNMDTSCLSIVGNSTTPLMQGATTSIVRGFMYNNSMYENYYWGCTAQDLASKGSIITTAVVAFQPGGDYAFKSSLFNPWSPPPCSVEASPASISLSLEARVDHHRHAAVHARGHSLVVPSNIIQNSSHLPSTVTSGSFTFTSPFIYANFYDITVVLFEGGVACSTYPVSMLTFTPGELSTIEGSHYDSSILQYVNGTTKPYNFADLPCPPQKTMEADWYKPEIGNPYRPLIALPQQVKNLQPSFRNCRDSFFTGYDPPRALAPQTALGPIITTIDPQPSTVLPMPSPTLDPGPQETGTGKDSMPGLAPGPASARTQSAPQPGKTPGKGSSPGQESSDNSKNSDPQIGNGSSPDQGAKLNLDPLSNDGKPGQNVNPKPNSQVGPSGDPEQDTNTSINPADSSTGGSGQRATPGSNLKSSNGQGAAEKYDPSSNTNSNAGQMAAPNHPVEPAQSNSAGIMNGDPVQNTGSPREPAGNNIAIGNHSPGQAATINGQVAQPLSQAISIAGTSLTPGAPPITIAGTLISLGPSVLVVGSSSVPITLPPMPLLPGQATKINDQIIQALSNGISIAGTTLTAGAPAITVSGMPISLGSTALVVGSSSIPLQTELPQQLITTVAGQAMTADPNAVEVQGSTLSPGGPGMTLGRTLVSLDAAGELIVGTRTIPLESVSGGLNRDEFITTFAGQALTANSNAVEFAGSTLKQGSPGVTMSGSLVSLDSAGELVIGSKTIYPGSSTPGLIIETFAPGGPFTTASTTPEDVTSNDTLAFKGNAKTLRGSLPWRLLALLIAIPLILLPL